MAFTGHSSIRDNFDLAPMDLIRVYNMYPVAVFTLASIRCPTGVNSFVCNAGVFCLPGHVDCWLESSGCRPNLLSSLFPNKNGKKFTSATSMSSP